MNGWPPRACPDHVQEQSQQGWSAGAGASPKQQKDASQDKDGVGLGAGQALSQAAWVGSGSDTLDRVGT